MPGFLKRLESLFFPVRIRTGSSDCNPFLELLYYRGRYMLATADAIYSDGDKYRPLLAAFAWPELSRKLSSVKNVLVLGTGLASAVHVLQRKGFQPQFTLVEIDSVVLDWALECLPAGSKERVRAVRADAFEFIGAETEVYDLLIVDIFFGRVVPPEVIGTSFLRQCRDRLAPDGVLVLNYMLAAENDPLKAKAALEATFANVRELGFGLNKVYIATVA
jgi:spermidine synthase